MTGSNDKPSKAGEAEDLRDAEPSAAEVDHERLSDDGEHEDAFVDQEPGAPGAGEGPPPPTASSSTRSATRAPRGASSGWRGAPAWVVPLYVAGLVLVFAGQRALSALETGATVLTATGVLAVLMATLVRFSPKFGAAGERGSIEALLRILSVLGVVALGLYAVTTDWGQDRFGLASQDLESRERVLGVLNVVWIALLLIATVPMLFAEASLRPMRRAERPESRRVRAAAGAGLTLVLAAVYGSLFVFSADAADIKVDYSYFKTSGPSESTLKMAQSLQDQVRVTAFFPDVNEVKTEVQGYLNELSRAAPKLKVEMTDRLLEPKKARDLRATQDGMIVLSKGKVTRSVVVGTELDAARTKLKTLDRDLQAELLKLARSRRTVYMTVGHGELNDKGNNSAEGRSARILDELLRKQNYTVKDLGIAQGLGSEVPADADVVMVLGPAEPFAPEEVSTLKRWVQAGGKLLLALDPDVISTSDIVHLSPGEGMNQSGESQPTAASSASAKPLAKAKATPPPNVDTTAPAEGTRAGGEGALGFEPLLKALGLSYSPIVLANENKHVRRRFNDSDRTMLVTSSFSSHASVSTLSRNAPRAAIVASGAGSLEPIEKVATKRPQNIDFAVRAEADTFADANRDFRREKDTEPAKSFTLAAAVSEKLAKDAKKSTKDSKDSKDSKGKDKDSNKDPLDDLNEMRAFVLSDADALSDLVLANVPGNQFLFVDAVRWLGGEESWSGQQTTEEDVRIEHTKKEDQVWFYSTIFGVPALVLGAGLFVSRRARQKHNKKGGKR